MNIDTNDEAESWGPRTMTKRQGLENFAFALGFVVETLKSQRYQSSLPVIILFFYQTDFKNNFMSFFKISSDLLPWENHIWQSMEMKRRKKSFHINRYSFPCFPYHMTIIHQEKKSPMYFLKICL